MSIAARTGARREICFYNHAQLYPTYNYLFLTTTTKSTVHDDVTEKESVYHKLWFPTTNTEMLTNRHVNGVGEGEIPHPIGSKIRFYGGGEGEIPHPRGSRVKYYGDGDDEIPHPRGSRVRC